MLNELAKQIHDNNIEKGFYEKEKNIGEMLALIHSEVSEALEADRSDNYFDPDTNCNKNRQFKEGEGWLFAIVNSNEDAWVNWFRAEVKNTFQDELSDIVIRVMDLAAYKGIDLERHIQLKMRYNALREYKHGKKY